MSLIHKILIFLKSGDKSIQRKRQAYPGFWLVVWSYYDSSCGSSSTMGDKENV